MENFLKVAEIDLIWFFINLGKAVGVITVLIIVYAMIVGDK